MPDPNPIAQLQRRLVELGCPVKATRKIVRETAEHYEDLQHAAQAQGLPPAESAARAAEQLGNPDVLAERHVEVLRKSSWWARHAFFTFGFLPLVTTAGIWHVYGLINGGQLPDIAVDILLAINESKIFLLAYFAVYGGIFAITALVTVFFCLRAQQMAVRRRWIWIIGILLAVQGLFL